jgi:hypothetical protein
MNPSFQVFSPAGAFQSTCRSDIWRVKDDMSRFKFPLRALKMLGERSMTQNGLENSYKREMKVDAVLYATTVDGLGGAKRIITT